MLVKKHKPDGIFRDRLAIMYRQGAEESTDGGWEAAGRTADSWISAFAVTMGLAVPLGIMAGLLSLIKAMLSNQRGNLSGPGSFLHFRLCHH